MKTSIALLLLVCLNASAQLTLTESSHGLQYGTNYHLRRCDSVSPLPQKTGINQRWDFSDLIPWDSLSNFNEQASVVNPSSSPQASLFPSATHALYKAYLNTYIFYNASVTQSELLGSYYSMGYENNSNPIVELQFPFSFGNSFTDTYQGIRNTMSGSNTVTASQTVAATGTGTLLLPGGIQLTNVLQVKSVKTETHTIAGGSVINHVQYRYFHAGNRFNILNVEYNMSSKKAFNILLNSTVITGLNDDNLHNNLRVYPNPCRSGTPLTFLSQDLARLEIQLYNTHGQILKSLSTAGPYNTTLSTDGLAPGIYLLRVTNQAQWYAAKLVIE